MMDWKRGLAMLGAAALLGIVPVVVAQESTPEANPSSVTTLRIWFPDALGSSEDSAVAATLSNLIGEFQLENPDAQVDFRLKQSGESSATASVYHNLRTARSVAPGALPHLTLLRRSDLTAAVRDGLITLLSDPGDNALTENLLPAAAPLGRVDDTLYGVPFMLEVQHQAVQPDVDIPATMSFDDLLAADWQFAFPAGQSDPISDVLSAQIAEAGGVTEEGMLAPQGEALTAIYQFYQDAMESGLLPPGTTGYEDPTPYLPLLSSGELPAGVVTSTDYLRLRAQGAELNAVQLPTLDGQPASVLDGWLWVIPTGTPQERALALRFIQWMNEPERQAAYAQSVHQIPAQREAFAQWATGDYGELVTQILDGTLPLTDWASNYPEMARALQSGLLQVLSGSVTARQAAQSIVPGE
ncbi:MAG: extracellular solute-binding protein [Anaerolineae bacterium]